MRLALEFVIERLEPERWVTSAQRRFDQVIGQRRVLREYGSVEVGADRVSVHAALPPVLGVVALADEDPAKRLCPRSQIGAAAMVLEPDQGAILPLDGEVAQRAHGASISDAAKPAAELSRAMNRVGGEQRETGQLSAVVTAVELAPLLKAATDHQRGRPVLDRGLGGVTFDLDHIFCDQALVGVSAATHQKQVDPIGVDGVAALQDLDVDLDVAPFASLCQADQVSAIPVVAHDTGVEESDCQFRHVFSSSRMSRGDPIWRASLEAPTSLCR